MVRLVNGGDITIVKDSQNNTDGLDSTIRISDLLRLSQAKQISANEYEKALSYSGIRPVSREDWLDFVKISLAVIGGVFLISGILFFFAYNWADLGKFQKIGLIQAGIVLSTSLILYSGISNLHGKLLVTAVFMLIGILMALFGQIYQTGADPYELFVIWSVIGLPLVLVTRFTVFWVIWLAIVNLAVILYADQTIEYRYADHLYPLLGIAVNGVFLLVWEYFIYRDVKFLQSVWVSRLVFTACIGLSTLLMAQTVLFNHFRYEIIHHVVNVLLYGGILAVSFIYFQQRKHDLVILSMTVLSLATLVFIALIERLDHSGAFLLIMSLLVLLEIVSAIVWIRKKQLQWNIKT